MAYVNVAEWKPEQVTEWLKDDLLIIVEGGSRKNIEEKSNQVLEGLDSWCKSVKLKMTLVKTTLMLFRGKLSRNPSIKIDGKAIRRSHMVR
uniref:Uncharacterized protein n=1 Tax=Timema monikensis TaxID=170555 RepID=A0A7R9EHP2_9NEOP|nr:unnamed protein product [Timema monikensis]